uniref:Uncharacterized protein n=1 Tax=Cannabis sativa TaxID=3483 RepID=A0A803P0U5_CANSA
MRAKSFTFELVATAGDKLVLRKTISFTVDLKYALHTHVAAVLRYCELGEWIFDVGWVSLPKERLKWKKFKESGMEETSEGEEKWVGDEVGGGDETEV